MILILLWLLLVIVVMYLDVDVELMGMLERLLMIVRRCVLLVIGMGFGGFLNVLLGDRVRGMDRGGRRDVVLVSRSLLISCVPIAAYEFFFLPKRSLPPPFSSYGRLYIAAKRRGDIPLVPAIMARAALASLSTPSISLHVT